MGTIDDGMWEPQSGNSRKATLSPISSHTSGMVNADDGQNDTGCHQIPKEGTFEYCCAHHPLAPLSTLQKHVLFWDRDLDGIIWPYQIYLGFRELGFGILFAIGALLISVFFSYPTRFARFSVLQPGTWRNIVPHPLLPIYLSTGAASIHGSDTGIYSYAGEFSQRRFEEAFDIFDRQDVGGLSAEDSFFLLQKNRCAWDVPGWCFAFMEWWTTWLLLQKDGRVWKDDLMACYEGSLFFRIAELERQGNWDRGYGPTDLLRGMWLGRNWRVWEVEKTRKAQ